MIGRNSYQIEGNDLVLKSGFNNGIYLLHDLEDDIAHLKKLKFKVDSNTYFANAAVAIDLILQDKKALQDKRYYKILTKLKEDLLYLQKHYEILSKPRNN